MTSAPSTTDDRVLTLPGLNTPENQVTGVEFAGYASVADIHDERLFYWFVGTQDYANRPTILWSNGGPGSSSFWGFFLENGPYEIESSVGDPIVRPRAHAWNRHANYMIFEHPLDVTLSFARDPAAVPKSVEQGIEQYYQALLNFLAKHPEIAARPIVLAGESYAGTYLPLLAQAIVAGNARLGGAGNARLGGAGNARPGGVRLDLRGTVLLDAWVSPTVQMATDTTYAFHHGLISAAQKRELDQFPLAEVNAEIQKRCGCYMANIAETGDPPFDPVLAYLNRADVREAIHAAPLGPSTQVTTNWSELVANNYQARVNESYAHVIEALLAAEQRIVVISGLNDAKDCNFLGTGAWLDQLECLAARRFHAAPTTQWRDPVTHQVLGYQQDGGLLRWLKVLNAGHLAVLDQPRLIEYILDAVGLSST